MQDNTSFTQNVDTLFSDLQNLTKTDTVLGTPITVENKTIVPLMSVTLGYGSTGMGARKQMGGSFNSSSDGHGLGAKISTSGVLIIDKENVQLLSTNESSAVNQMMSKIPQALAGMGQSSSGGGNQGQGQQQGSSSQSQQSSQNSSSKGSTLG
jgi:uncharacterized spore protein YtfJ